MTAIIGVLNKHSVAIAADSAATLGGGRKVMNTANKLFALSKYYPVAIAVYGNAELLGTPWEVIIKEYTLIKEGSEEAEKINAEHVLIKEREKKKLLPGDIVKMMVEKGYRINMHQFVQCWKTKDAKKNNTYGVQVAKTWYWYENFIPVVEQYCKDNNL